MNDKLRQALGLLAESTEPNPSFDLIAWCPEKSVLSFRRTGDAGWVFLWLKPDGQKHIAENNNTGPAGTNPETLWVLPWWP